MKRFIGSILFALSCLAITAVMVPPSVGQLIYGNTFPFWNVSGPLTVTGTSTLSGGGTITGATLVNSTMTGTTPIVGITTSGVAAAGNVGEVLTGTTTAISSVALTSGYAAGGKGFGCVALTPGDWQLQATGAFSTAAATFSSVIVGVTTNALSNVVPAYDAITAALPNATAVSGLSAVVVSSPIVPVNLNATTTYCGTANAGFASGDASIWGKLNARRMR